MCRDVALKCPTCGEWERMPVDEADPTDPDYMMNPCDACAEEALGDD